MVKRKSSYSSKQIATRQGNGQHLERTEEFDDNLLPDAGEIERLYTMDPTILDWLKSTTEKEQNFRHSETERRTNIVAKIEKGERNLNTLGLTFGFIIVAGGMVLSYFLLIEKDNLWLGSIFAGGTIITAASLFIKRHITDDNSRKK